VARDNGALCGDPFRPTSPAGPTTERVWYFGAWLDFNDPNVRLPASYQAAPDGPYSAASLHPLRTLMRDFPQCMVPRENWRWLEVIPHLVGMSTTKTWRFAVAIILPCLPSWPRPSHQCASDFRTVRTSSSTSAQENSRPSRTRTLPGSSMASETPSTPKSALRIG
jgi:hypothetical protein